MHTHQFFERARRLDNMLHSAEADETQHGLPGEAVFWY